MAQVIFENLCKKNGRKDIVVKSAGLFTLNGLPVAQNATEALIRCGEKLGRKILKTTRYNPKTKYDLVITMTNDQADKIGAQSLDSLTGCGDITDPFMQPVEVFMTVCKRLQDALVVLYDKICNKLL